MIMNGAKKASVQVALYLAILTAVIPTSVSTR